MFDGYDDMFGDLCDFDGDGECSFGEAFLAHELFASDEELQLEYGEPDDGTASRAEEDDDDSDFDETGEYQDDTGEADMGSTGQNRSGNDSVTIPVKISFSFGSGNARKGVQRSDYPNERTYEAADLLDSIEQNPDIYGDSDNSDRIKKCRFILDHPEITAAKYLNLDYGFLFAQAVKERFKLPFSIPDDDEKIHTLFSDLFRKLSRYNQEYAIRIWHWVLTMFLSAMCCFPPYPNMQTNR